MKWEGQMLPLSPPRKVAGIQGPLKLSIIILFTCYKIDSVPAVHI